jgi:hypothetical protein
MFTRNARGEHLTLSTGFLFLLLSTSFLPLLSAKEDAEGEKGGAAGGRKDLAGKQRRVQRETSANLLEIEIFSASSLHYRMNSLPSTSLFQSIGKTKPARA